MALERHIARVHRHEQADPAAVWVINHNLGIFPIVDAWTMHEGDLQKILPAEVTYVDGNTCNLIFSTPITGYATVV